MAILKLIAAVLFMATTAASYSSGEECDFSVVDLDTAVEEILANLPTNYTLTKEKFFPVIAGLEAGPLSVSGLDKIRQYGAVQPYCVRGTRFLQVDLVNNADVAFYMPWRTCSGHEGHVTLFAELSRFTVLLRVDRGGFAENFVLRYEGPTVPVNTYSVHLLVKGAGVGGKIASGILSKFFPAFVNELWNDHFFNYFTHFLRITLQ
ncbi:hypothetical protein HPB49_015864 [Dermacentor silvarum]|uniref:Uncharacterized protein n=1 Tax=Dermacentor silvarum TaxID=543639 RepID=A0ACB8CG60_DERSI|nr:uncharacterized protein LOC119459562 [Dermacentor silvarum]KAH7941662.1 hypothetical protein HPB49_015864 [Dermacentor silvarum]